MRLHSMEVVGKVDILRSTSSESLIIVADIVEGRSGLKIEDARVTSWSSRLRIRSPSWKPVSTSA